MNLPSQEILEQAWSLIKHLSSGGNPVSGECRQMVLKAQIEKEEQGEKPELKRKNPNAILWE